MWGDLENQRLWADGFGVANLKPVTKLADGLEKRRSSSLFNFDSIQGDDQQGSLTGSCALPGRVAPLAIHTTLKITVIS
jgi:hypothetical protein